MKKPRKAKNKARSRPSAPQATVRAAETRPQARAGLAGPRLDAAWRPASQPAQSDFGLGPVRFAVRLAGWPATATPVLALAATRAGRNSHASLASLTYATARAYTPEDRETLALLMVPFLLLAMLIGSSQALRPLHRLAPFETAEGRIARPGPLPPSTGIVRELAASRALVSASPRLPPRLYPDDGRVSSPIGPVRIAPQSGPVLALAPAAAVAAAAPGSITQAKANATTANSPTAIASSAALLALNPPPAVAMLDPAILSPPEPEPGRASPRSTGPAGVCVAPPLQPPAAIARSLGPTERATFGRRLAEAARGQQADLVVYTDRYRHIAYPMGDVAPLYGVCSDVVIRAYRALGLDLQALVHVAKGGGDTNIDHRRVETLRAFFATHGERLPITDIADDYQAGDIVTYYRPQNRHSRSHIAVVAAETGVSGRPLIIHNRGWGPQSEDALFVDQITGHYRYAGPAAAAGPSSAEAVPPAGRPAAHRVALRGTPARALKPTSRPNPRTAALPQ